MYRVRADSVGPTPKGRNLFQPENFLEHLYSEKDVIVCDSEKFEEMILIEDEHIEQDTDECEADEHEETESETPKLMPKRVLAYTHKKLLTLLSMNLKTSVDGTFKSCCKLWRQ